MIERPFCDGSGLSVTMTMCRPPSGPSSVPRARGGAAYLAPHTDTFAGWRLRRRARRARHLGPRSADGLVRREQRIRAR